MTARPPRGARTRARAHRGALRRGLRGAGASRLAQAAGAPADPRIVPFRGAYLYLRPERRSLVRGLIYPVPDPSLPFLGVHLSRHIDGQVSLGPTALLAPRAAADLTWPGTRRMVRRWWRTGLSELRHAPQPALAAAAAAQYVPELRRDDFAGFAGRPRAGARPRRAARGRLRGVRDRARPARAQRALARGHLGLRAGAPDRRSRRAGAGLGAALGGTAPIEPAVHGDARGFFLESYRRERLAELGVTHEFVQDNHSRSARGVLRGMHFQPGQAKLVRCARRDPRRHRRHPARPETFGAWEGVELDDEGHRQLYVPDGFAHGFCVLSDVADVI